MATWTDKRRLHRRLEDRQLRQRERELDAARRICQELSRHLNVDELVKRALTTALDVVNAEAGSVLLADAEAKTLVFRYRPSRSWPRRRASRCGRTV